jgi:hypothetical protein
MQVINVNKDKQILEICLTREELVIIIKTFAYIGIGLQTDEYMTFYNVEKESIDKLSDEFRKTRSFFSQNVSENKKNQIVFKKNNVKNGLINIELDELHRKAIFGALSHAGVWLYEEDCNLMLGISWDDLLNVRANLLMLLRGINNSGL